MDNKIDQEIDISIIIVNYKSYDMTDNCIASIIKNTNGINYEILIADNSFEADSINSIQNKYPDLKIIKNEFNLGFAAANNQCINIAKGKYMLFLNNDTLFLENSVKKIFDFCESLNYSCFLGCKLLNEDLTHQDSITDFENIFNIIGENLFLYKLFPSLKLFNKYNKNREQSTSVIEVDVIKGAFMYCLTNDIRQLNGFDERFFFYSEETDLCYRYKKMGGKIFYYPDTAIIHLGKATVMKNLWFKFKNQSIAKIQFYQKHFSGTILFFSVLIHYLGILIRIPIYLFMGVVKLSKFNFLKAYYYSRILFIYPKNKFHIDRYGAN
jgi:GT2 family glycosyltransferase